MCRKVVRACSQPQGMFLHFETWRSGVGECAGPGEVPPLGVDSVPSGRNGADPEPPFREGERETEGRKGKGWTKERQKQKERERDLWRLVKHASELFIITVQDLSPKK